MRNSISLAAVAIFMTVTSCVPLMPPTKARLVMPLAATQQPRQRLVVEREFRLGTFDFGRASGDGGDLSNIIPAMLATELRANARFSIYEGGNIRSDEQNELLNEKNAKNYLDGYLSGTITLASPQQTCFEVRLSNAVSYEVLYSRSSCVALGERGQVDRSAVKRIAEEIERAVKKIGYGKVTSSDGKMVFFDKGTRSGVSRGMVAYIVATGDTVADVDVHRAVQSYTETEPSRLATAAVPVVVGEIYVSAVEEEYSTGILYNGEYVLPGDTIFFK